MYYIGPIKDNRITIYSRKEFTKDHAELLVKEYNGDAFSNIRYGYVPKQSILDTCPVCDGNKYIWAFRDGESCESKCICNECNGEGVV